MQKILVTGANGFVGYYVVKYLLENNFYVLATGKGPTRLPFASDHFEYHTLDFTDEFQVCNFFIHHKPSVVIHSGAMSKPDECEENREAAFRTNVTGTIHLLNNAEDLKCFFLFISTDFVFDGAKGMYDEEAATGAVNYYGTTKQLAEEETMKYQSDRAIVRTVLVYGKPFLNRQNLLTNTANALKKGEELKIFNDQVRTPTYVEDLAKAIVTIITKRATGIFHISGEDVLTPYEMAVATATFLGLNKSLITPVTEDDFKQPARRPLKTGFDITKAKKMLGYKPTGFTEGLRLTFSN